MARELGWLAPFVTLVAITCVMLRPWPVFPPPAHYRLAEDGKGQMVKVPVPLKGVLSYKALDDTYLMYSHAPEMLWKAGAPDERKGYDQSFYGRIFPYVAARASLWDMPRDIESALAAYDGGTIYFWPGWTWGGDARLGMTGFNYTSGGMDKPQTTAAVIGRMLGQEARAGTIIAAYEARVADLAAELQVDSLTRRPRTVRIWGSSDDWSALGVGGGDDLTTGVSDGTKYFHNSGRGAEAERILAMNPDLIFLSMDRDAFFCDPRFRGLEALRTGRVYQVADFAAGASFYHIDLEPFASRWKAEIAHPERLKPRLREQMRDYFVKSYRYRLSDAQLNKMLSITPNHGAPGYERFEARPRGAAE